VLAEVIESVQPGFAQRPSEEDEGRIPQIRTHNVTPDGRISLEGIKHVTVVKPDMERYRLLPGEVIFNNTNSEEWVGKTALFNLAEGVFVYSNHMTRIRVQQDVLLPAFLAAYLHFLWAAGYSRNRAKRWVSQAAIDVPTLLKFKIPLPPFLEQQRVVEMLREADSLVHGKANAAQRFDDLIQAHYRQQFGHYFASDGLRNPARIGEYIESAQYGISEAMDESGSHAILRMNSITTSGWLDLSDLKYVDLPERDAQATQLRNGDLLFNRTNSKELVGKCAIWRDVPGRFSFASYLVRLRLKEGLSPEFLWTTLNSPYGKYRLFNAAKQAVSMANVSPTDLARITIPLPPPQEQQAFADFVRAIEAQRKQLVETAGHFGELIPALVSQALSGCLTAAWREQHRIELDAAIRARDEVLGPAAPPGAVQITGHAPPERNKGFARLHRQALIDQLSSFQHEVWNTLRFEWPGAVLTDDPTVFEDFCTSPQMGWRLEGFEAGRDEVRRALEQLAAMGLVRKMSLPHANPTTGRTDYLTAFRSLREADTGGRAEEDTALQDAERVAKQLQHREQGGR